MSSKKTDKASFGTSFAELEKIVAKFENEEVDLEEGLKDFEHALVLARTLKERLSDVENKVVEIKKKFKDVVDEESSPQSTIGM
jgi:exodeoxyribonuclease VII small subunit